ncbi:MAG: hypothetical protein JWO69_321 [Thermoleophilia bacterium]|nr:hypothetical protein [Thermoleophilia bacterium]
MSMNVQAPNVLDPSLRDAASKGPVDAVVFFRTPETTRTTGVASTFAGIEAMPLGAERKVAAYEAVHTLGTAALDANRSIIDGLVAKGSTVDELWSLGAVRIRGASLDTLASLVGPNIQAIIQDERIPAPTLPAVISDTIDGATEITIPPFDADAASTTGNAGDPDAIYMDWGVHRMKASDAWKQGITGAGITIGSLDTGVATNHVALKANYRGNLPDGTQQHDYSWKDMVKETPADGKLPDGSDFAPDDRAKNGTSRRPIDLNGHGTHTSGSAVGWSPNHLTGVAPDAKLIVSRGLGEKGGSMFDLVAAMEWFMAPTKVDGTAPRPDLAPDIVTNSWGGAAMGNPFLWMAVRNWKRAGIIPIFASGNDAVNSPGKVAVPGMYPEVVTVGASDLDESRAWFSMYGPSDFSNDHKPEGMAPGHWTYSSLPDGTVRDTFPVKMPDGSIRTAPASGTSMATPHVAGAAALFMQAHPGASYDEVLHAMTSSGTLASNSNDEQGYGRVQVDQLISPGSIDPSAQLTDPARVEELMTQVAAAKVFMEGERKPGIPKKADAPA